MCVRAFLNLFTAILLFSLVKIEAGINGYMYIWCFIAMATVDVRVLGL